MSDDMEDKKDRGFVAYSGSGKKVEHYNSENTEIRVKHFNEEFLADNENIRKIKLPKLKPIDLNSDLESMIEEATREIPNSDSDEYTSGHRK